MSLVHGSRIPKNGIVFSYDMGSRQSYAGPPMYNLTGTKGASNFSATGQEYISGEEITRIPELGKTKAITCDMYNHYTSHSPNSSTCCPSPINYGFYRPIAGNTLHTYLILYRVQSGYTNANYMYRYEYNSGTYVTEAGVHTTSKRVHLGEGWYYAWNTFTTNSSTNQISPRLFYYRYSTEFDKISVAKACIIEGDYSGLHPRYWPEPDTTRSNTQAIIDVMGGNTVTPSNINYSTDGTFNFPGSSSNITVSTGITGNEYTILLWHYNSASSYTVAGHRTFVASSNFRFQWDDAPDRGPFVDFKSTVGGGQANFGALSNSDFLGTHTMVGLVSTGTTVKTTFNNITTGQSTTISGSRNFSTNGNIVIGLDNLSGIGGADHINREGGTVQMPLILVYNRALSDSEIVQVYDATRVKYGV